VYGHNCAMYIASLVLSGYGHTYLVFVARLV